MWRLIFSVETNRGVDYDREPLSGEYARMVDRTVCGWFRETPERYQWTGTALIEYPGWEAELALKTLQKERKLMLARLSEEYNVRTSGGIGDDGVWYPSDLVSRLRYLDLKDAISEIVYGPEDPPETTQVVVDEIPMTVDSLENAETVLTVDLLLTLVKKGRKLDVDLDKALNDHIRAIKQSDDPLAYDITTDWPNRYTG